MGKVRGDQLELLNFVSDEDLNAGTFKGMGKVCGR